MSKDQWIKNAAKPKNKGLLREKLGAKAGKPIPEKKLIKAEESKNPTLRKEAVLANTLKGFKKK